MFKKALVLFLLVVALSDCYGFIHQKTFGRVNPRTTCIKRGGDWDFTIGTGGSCHYNVAALPTTCSSYGFSNTVQYYLPYIAVGSYYGCCDCTQQMGCSAGGGYSSNYYAVCQWGYRYCWGGGGYWSYDWRYNYTWATQVWCQ